MAEEYITRSEFNERGARLDRENERQNERLRELEQSIGEINRLAISTEKLASAMEKMLEEQKEQGRRIAKLEGHDGEKWRGAVKTVAEILIGAAVGAVLMMLGLRG